MEAKSEQEPASSMIVSIALYYALAAATHHHHDYDNWQASYMASRNLAQEHDAGILC
jgi:hypothetical protein